ncbi:MAG: VOC family protein [Planctomycetaceae bacterium]|nr:VOC family protein [Planctomycetaceae bacterium]
MTVEPYLFFEGRCEDALKFYEQALGAKIGMVLKYKDSPDKPPEGMLPPNSGDKVMHSEMQIGESRIFCSDGGCSGSPTFGGFSVSLSVKSAAEAEQLFNALMEGGRVTMPLGKTFFSLRFGMLTDKFGVDWMVNAVQEMK